MSEQGGPYRPTGPGQPGQSGGNPGQWQQPGPGQQGWQQPQGAPQQGWQQPQGGPQQGWQQPQGAPQQGWQQPPAGAQGTQAFPQPGGAPEWQGAQSVQQSGGQPGGKSNKPLIITAIVVVLALVVGVGVWFFGFRDSGRSTAASGEANPQAAVDAMFVSLGNSDPIGLADQLDPAEAALFTDLNADVIGQLKRLGVLSDAASADSMTGTTISVSGLTYDGTPEQVTNNVQVVKLTGGTITYQSDLSQAPISDKVRNAFGDVIDQGQPQSGTIQIADLVAENDGKPFRLATVQRDGEWYVSLFYTIADNAVHQSGVGNPTPGDAIPAQGSPNAEAAADAFLSAATKGDLETLIKLTPPDEMGALHDYGRLILDQAGSELSGAQDLGITIDDVQWEISDVTGGQKASIRSLSATVDGDQVRIDRDVTAGTLTLTLPGQPTITLDDATLESLIGEASGGQQLDPQLVDIIKREFKQIIGVGLVSVEVDGQWYVSPIRSFTDVFVSLLQGLEPGDVDYLIELAEGGF